MKNILMMQTVDILPQHIKLNVLSTYELKKTKEDLRYLFYKIEENADK